MTLSGTWRITPGGEVEASNTPTSARHSPAPSPIFTHSSFSLQISVSFAIRAQDRRVQFTPEDENRRNHVEKHKRDHHRGEARVGGDIIAREFGQCPRRSTWRGSAKFREQCRAAIFARLAETYAQGQAPAEAPNSRSRSGTTRKASVRSANAPTMDSSRNTHHGRKFRTP